MVRVEIERDITSICDFVNGHKASFPSNRSWQYIVASIKSNECYSDTLVACWPLSGESCEQANSNIPDLEKLCNY